MPLAIAAALLRDVDRLEAVATALASTPTRGRMLDSIQRMTAGSIAALREQSDEAVDAFVGALDFAYLRLDRAQVQALFATVVGRASGEARRASDAAYDLFTACGATAFTDLYAGGMPQPAARGGRG